MDSYKVLYVQRIFRSYPHRFVRLTGVSTLATVTSINNCEPTFRNIGGWLGLTDSAPLLPDVCRVKGCGSFFMGSGC